jgi:hypothetical protein
METPELIFQWSPSGLMLLERNAETPTQWVCRQVNPAAIRLLGIQQPFGQALNNLLPAAAVELLAETTELEAPTPAAEFFALDSSRWLLAQAHYQATQLILSLTDIQRQKEAAFADIRMSKLYKSLSSSLADNEIILFDKDFNVVFTEGNPRFIRLNLEENVIGKNLNNLIENNTFSFLGEHISNVFGGQRHDLEYEVGGTFYKASLYADQREEDGAENVIGVLLLCDVTEINRKQRELELLNKRMDRSNKERFT